MLPPRETGTHCPRCEAPLGGEQRTCSACGAECAAVAVAAARLRPAAAALAQWLMIFALVLLALAGLVFADNRHWMAPDAVYRMMAPSVLAAGVLIILSALAERWPLSASLVALVLFTADWGDRVLADPAGAFRPDPALALRLILLVVLVAAAVRVGAATRAVRRAGRTAPPNR